VAEVQVRHDLAQQRLRKTYVIPLALSQLYVSLTLFATLNAANDTYQMLRYAIREKRYTEYDEVALVSVLGICCSLLVMYYFNDCDQGSLQSA